MNAYLFCVLKCLKQEMQPMLSKDTYLLQLTDGKGINNSNQHT